MKSEVWVDGVLNGGIPGDDPGLLLGLTVFETLRTYGEVPFRLQAHLRRLTDSAAAMGFKLPPISVIESEIYDVCRSDVSIRLTFTAGGHRILQRTPIDLKKVARNMSVAPMRWDVPVSLPGPVKHGARASWVLEARRLKVDEVFLVDARDFILEANRSNVFAVIGETIVTPPLDGRQLAGVTRAALLEAATEAQLQYEERPLHLEDNFAELYLASTLKELSPVVQLAERKGPGGGPIGAALLSAFRRIVARETQVA